MASGESTPSPIVSTEVWPQMELLIMGSLSKVHTQSKIDCQPRKRGDTLRLANGSNHTDPSNSHPNVGCTNMVDRQGSAAIPRLIPQSSTAAQMASVAHPTGTKMSAHVQLPPAPSCSH